MAVRIRLTRVGATKRPAYRVIAIDQRRPRDGRALEILGYYDPLTEPATVQLETAKISAWLGKGAQPSDTVVRLMRQAEKAAAGPAPSAPPKRATRPKAAPKPRAAPKAAGGATPGDGDAGDGATSPAAEPETVESESATPAASQEAEPVAAGEASPAEEPEA